MFNFECFSTYGNFLVFTLYLTVYFKTILLLGPSLHCIVWYEHTKPDVTQIKCVTEVTLRHMKDKYGICSFTSYL